MLTLAAVVAALALVAPAAPARTPPANGTHLRVRPVEHTYLQGADDMRVVRTPTRGLQLRLTHVHPVIEHRGTRRVGQLAPRSFARIAGRLDPHGRGLEAAVLVPGPRAAVELMRLSHAHYDPRRRILTYTARPLAHPRTGLAGLLSPSRRPTTAQRVFGYAPTINAVRFPLQLSVFAAESLVVLDSGGQFFTLPFTLSSPPGGDTARVSLANTDPAAPPPVWSEPYPGPLGLPTATLILPQPDTASVSPLPGVRRPVRFTAEAPAWGGPLLNGFLSPGATLAMDLGYGSPFTLTGPLVFDFNLDVR